jgi:hypothetical protein
MKHKRREEEEGEVLKKKKKKKCLEHERGWNTEHSIVGSKIATTFTTIFRM